jgi:hypothetical protein
MNQCLRENRNPKREVGEAARRLLDLFFWNMEELELSSLGKDMFIYFRRADPIDYGSNKQERRSKDRVQSVIIFHSQKPNPRI